MTTPSLIFTTSGTPLSALIRRVTGEPVSHCGILVGGLVIHSTFGGVQITHVEDFKEHSEIVFSLEWPDITPGVVLNILRVFLGKGYDYLGLLYLGLRYVSKIAKKIFPFLPTTGKVNIWESSGLYLCTEFLTTAILKQTDSLITPYQLYLKLLNSTKG